MTHTSERYLGTADGCAVYVKGNRVIVRKDGIEWNHSIGTWRRGGTDNCTTLAREVNNLVQIEFGPDR